MSQANGTAIIAITVRVRVIFVQFANVTSTDLGITNTGNVFHAHNQTKKRLKIVEILIAEGKNIIFKNSLSGGVRKTKMTFVKTLSALSVISLNTTMMI